MRTYFPFVGSFGIVCASHPIAAQVGLAMLERGGNAFDAAAAAALTLHVIMPDQTGPAGEVAAVLYDRQHGVEVLCGQGVAPAAATLDHFARLGLDLIPRHGLLPAVTPGAFDAWLLLLQERGTLTLADVLEPALHYAESGYPATPRMVAYIERGQKQFASHWHSTADLYMPAGRLPSINQRMVNPAYAMTLRRIKKHARQSGKDRNTTIAAARSAFMKGFVAESIDRFCRVPCMDDTGELHCGVMSGADLATWQATFEPPLQVEYGGLTISKPGPWSQAPVFLQQLQLLKGFDLDGLDPSGPDFVHLVVECAKLAFADKAAYYGDPNLVDVPIADLLSQDYADSRRQLVNPGIASETLRPGSLESGRALPAAFPRAMGVALRGVPRDTAHIDVVDRWGNMISATPSGGWFDESPVIPDLGFPLSTRGQHFRLVAGHPNALAPGKRPVTTLSATIATQEDGRCLGFGTPGGDQQDQWSLIFLLRHLHCGLDLAEANASPMFHTRHMISSYAPFKFEPRRLLVEHTMPPATVEELRRRGHDVRVGTPPADYYGAQNFGSLSAVARQAGTLMGVGSERWPLSYCVGR
jgi:gamma-glutamyltranspeptidase/glutathione hydrolase